MDIENSMVVGAQDVYDGCGREYDRSSSLEEAREYFLKTDEGLEELHEHLLDGGYYNILRLLAISAKTGVNGGASTRNAIEAVSFAAEFLANKKVNGVHQ